MAKAKITAAATNEQERDRQLQQATRRYRNQRVSFQQTPSLGGIVGYVELLCSNEATADQVTEMQREQRRTHRNARAPNTERWIAHDAPGRETTARLSPSDARTQ